VLNEKINEIERLVAAEKDKASQKKGSANGRVDIVLFSDEDGSGIIDLKLTYSAMILFIYSIPCLSAKCYMQQLLATLNGNQHMSFTLKRCETV